MKSDVGRKIVVDQFENRETDNSSKLSRLQNNILVEEFNKNSPMKIKQAFKEKVSSLTPVSPSKTGIGIPLYRKH